MLLQSKKRLSHKYLSIVATARNTGFYANSRQLCFGFIALVSLASCANLAGPEYTRPDVPTKAAWSQSATISASKVIRPDWWAGFGDPYLNELVDRAIADSIDLRILAARIGEARASVGLEQTAALPTLRAGVNGSLTKTGHSVLSDDSQQNLDINGALNWEIDIWGRVQKGVNSREAAFNASEADWRAGYLTLIADVASTYFQIRETDELIAQQQWTIDKNQQILAINQAQFSEGLVSAVQVMQQEAEISRLQQQLQDFQRVRQIAENQLATLLGTPAGEFKVPVANLSNTVHLLDVPSGLPSDLLERRPDIIAAEYRVLEANELIGQAKLAKLPRLSLTSTANRNIVSSALTGLIKTWTLGLGPAIDIPLFDPSLEAQVKVNEAQTQTVSEEYRRTVITAFEEVENALVNLANRKTQKETLEKQIDTLRVVNDQVYAQLREGLVSQLEVFESERRLLEAQQDLLQLQQQLLTDTVTLYKALGGGWPKEHVELAKPESGLATSGRSML